MVVLSVEGECYMNAISNFLDSADNEIYILLFGAND